VIGALIGPIAGKIMQAMGMGAEPKQEAQ
jgi:hypothetical protein